MKKASLLLLIITIISCLRVQAQICFAVAKDENGSSIKWEVAMNKGYLSDTEYAAMQALKNAGYKNITTLTCPSCGHNLKSGYWVVVEKTYKRYDNKMITAFGMGASSNSIIEAEENAVKNMVMYCGSLNKSDGHTISEKGTF